MKKSLLVLLFGFSPIWVAIILVVAGAHARYVPYEYWAVAPWLIIYAVPVCAVTFPLTLLAVRYVEPGEPTAPERKQRSLANLAETSLSTINELKSPVLAEWRHWPHQSSPATLVEVRAFYDWLVQVHPELLSYRGTRVGWYEIQEWLEPYAKP